MKREEEIKNQAPIIADKIWKQAHIGFYDELEYCDLIFCVKDSIKWADETIIERVCNYLKSKTYQEYPGGPSIRLLDDSFIEDLKKAMEE